MRSSTVMSLTITTFTMKTIGSEPRIGQPPKQEQVLWLAKRQFGLCPFALGWSGLIDYSPLPQWRWTYACEGKVEMCIIQIVLRFWLQWHQQNIQLGICGNVKKISGCILKCLNLINYTARIVTTPSLWLFWCTQLKIKSNWLYSTFSVLKS